MAAAAAGRRGTRPMPALASAMAAARSPLMARMDALLEGSSLAGATPARRRLVRVLLAGGLCAVALAVPMLVIGKAPRLNVDLSGVSDMVSSTMTSAMGGKITRHTSIGDGVERRVVYTGDLTFNADETDVESLPGTLTIRESRDGLSRRIEIKADGKGGQIRRYWLNGESTPIDASAQIWLTEQIGLIAESAQGSEPRARRLLTQGGLDAVLADIDKAKEAFVRRSRVEGLLATGPQSDETISRLIALIADMGDDFQRRTALTALLEHRTLGPTQQRELLAAIDGFHGDFERRQVLQAIAPQLSHDASVLDAWQEAVKGIGGDFERRTAIVALLEEGSVDRELSLRVLGAIEGVSGDYERAQMLVALAEHMPGDAELIAKCRQAARGLSMHERGRVEQALDDVTGA
jgi:hypothetical protein